MQKNMTRRLCVIAVLIAMQIVLGRIAAINVGSYLKISFGFIPIAVCGILCGPFWTLLMGAVCDILGALLFPTGAFYWGFTLVAAAGGTLTFPGWVREGDEVTVEAAPGEGNLLALLLALPLLIARLARRPPVLSRALALLLFLPCLLYTVALFRR